MDLQKISWRGGRAPGESSLKRNLESEGYDVSLWRDPADRTYEPHSHTNDESLWVLRGRIVLKVEEAEYALEAGDRLLLPKGTVHTAQAGPDGATYLIGQKR